MKRAVMLLTLVMVMLTVIASVVLAKPGNNTDEVCWVSPNQGEKTAHFMMTGSGIVHRFMDGRHDIYKPQEKFERPPGDGWIPWMAKEHEDCDTATPVSVGEYLKAGDTYWHKYN
jgi:hypothetical protein